MISRLDSNFLRMQLLHDGRTDGSETAMLLRYNLFSHIGCLIRAWYPICFEKLFQPNWPVYIYLHLKHVKSVRFVLMWIVPISSFICKASLIVMDPSNFPDSSSVRRPLPLFRRFSLSFFSSMALFSFLFFCGCLRPVPEDPYQEQCWMLKSSLEGSD